MDDAAVMRMRLKEILEPRYKVVAEAVDGEQALEQFLEHRPDIVTLDITMPNVDGLQALSMILTADPRACVVIVSAVGQKQVVFEALGKGAKDFIVKPFERERVMMAVDRLFT